MTKKIKYLAGGASAALLGIVAPFLAHADTDPLGVASTSAQVVDTTKTYIGILVTNYWPLVLGGLVLGAVVGVVIWVFHQFKIGGGR